eukprot:m.94833 g.94833  ORF g.94833 m.94833 type:complete len:187 (-) comp16570_c0_seq7:65-625(-)
MSHTCDVVACCSHLFNAIHNLSRASALVPCCSNSATCVGMEVKMSDEQISYPMLYFSIDNFDDLFEGMVVRAGHDACVELVASVDSIATTIFSGSVTHAQLMASFLSRKSGSKHRSKRGTERTMEFLNMRGPNGVGHAEMAVSRVIAEKNLKGTMSGFLQKLGQCANRLACAQWPKRMHACIVVLP